MWTWSGQSSSGQGCGRQHEGVCFNISTWKILRGNIMDSAADVSVCLHAWNWGWALWSKWKRTAEVCSVGESKLCTESKSETVPTSGFSQVPLQSLPSVIRDMGIPRPVALIHLSLGTACDHLASPMETLWVSASSGRPPMPACFLLQSSFLYQLCSSISRSFYYIQYSLLSAKWLNNNRFTVKEYTSPWFCWAKKKKKFNYLYPQWG